MTALIIGQVVMMVSIADFVVSFIIFVSDDTKEDNSPLTGAGVGILLLSFLTFITGGLIVLGATLT